MENFEWSEWNGMGAGELRVWGREGRWEWGWGSQKKERHQNIFRAKRSNDKIPTRSVPSQGGFWERRSALARVRLMCQRMVCLRVCIGALSAVMSQSVGHSKAGGKGPKSGIERLNYFLLQCQKTCPWKGSIIRYQGKSAALMLAACSPLNGNGLSNYRLILSIYSRRRPGEAPT